MKSYYPSDSERLIISKCISLGFTVYVVATRQGNNPPVVLEVNFNGRIIPSSEPEFDQKYSCYKITDVYKKFYNKIKNKL